MRFEPEGITSNPEIPFAKSMPDYIMRWLASRFLDTDAQEELGILTPEVRARKAAQEHAISRRALLRHLGAGERTERPKPPRTPPTAARPSGEPPSRRGVHRLPAGRPRAGCSGLDLGPACTQCGGMMQRTGSCYTCPSCGNNTGCGGRRGQVHAVTPTRAKLGSGRPSN
jgi:ribonucleoside-diphosphate reductase alpha chain